MSRHRVGAQKARLLEYASPRLRGLQRPKAQPVSAREPETWTFLETSASQSTSGPGVSLAFLLLHRYLHRRARHQGAACTEATLMSRVELGVMKALASRNGVCEG